jgi:hypothetical protein
MKLGAIKRSDSMLMRASTMLKKRIASKQLTWEEKVATKSLVDLIKTHQFILLFTMNFLSIFFGVFIVGSEKTWG